MNVENRQQWWNAHYLSADRGTVSYDNWISKHLKLFPEKARVIEFGCGLGLISEVLNKAGYSVTATDLAPAAVAATRERVPGIAALQIDFEKPLPFAPSSFDVAVADLCLHYFDLSTTHHILSQISRILCAEGLLCARVNSAKDYNYGAGVGREVEPGFYEHEGHYKRFFDREMVDEVFSDWSILSVENYDISKMQKPKNVFEVVLRKKV